MVKLQGEKQTEEKEKEEEEFGITTPLRICCKQLLQPPNSPLEKCHSKIHNSNDRNTRKEKKLEPQEIDQSSCNLNECTSIMGNPSELLYMELVSKPHKNQNSLHCFINRQGITRI